MLFHRIIFIIGLKSGVIFKLFSAFCPFPFALSNFASLGALTEPEGILMLELFVSYFSTIFANILEKELYPKYFII